MQVASHGARFTLAGGQAVEPDVGFEWTEYGTFGAGVNVRFDESLVVGFTASVIAPRSDELFARSLEAGLHLGYSWQP